MLRSTSMSITRALRPVMCSASITMQPRLFASANAIIQPVACITINDARSYSTNTYQFSPSTNSSTLNESFTDDIPSKSITTLVADVLRTGPKTRAQIFFAINRGPLMSRPIKPNQPKNPEKYKRGKNLINQHPPLPLHTYQQMAKKQADLIKKAQSNQIIEEYDPLTYPSGPLRNPAHLTNVLQYMLKGKRLHARPFKSISHRYGDKEAASTQEILQRFEPEYLAKRKIALMKEGKSESEADAMLPQGPQVTPRLAGPQNPKAHGRIANQYVYVLRDWIDPKYEARAPLLIERARAKKERRAHRLAEREESNLPENIAARKEAEAKKAIIDAELAAKERVRMYRAHALNMSDKQQAEYLSQKRTEDEEDEAEAAAQR
jgi:hypothetical protein